MSNVATIGHNNPPTPFEEVEKEITDLYGEAKNFLDGEPISTQGMADAVSNLLNLIRAAEKKADALRKEEVQPFDEGKAAVQERYAPLIADTKTKKGMTVLAADACKKALTPWLEKIDAEKRAAAEAARKEAEEKERLAREAMRASKPDDLEAREAAEKLVEDAKKADRMANRAEKATTKAAGGIGKAVGLRTDYVPELTDGVAAARHYWTTKRAEMEAFLLDLAKKDVRAGKREIPGFTIKEEKKAV